MDWSPRRSATSPPACVSCSPPTARPTWSARCASPARDRFPEKLWDVAGRPPRSSGCRSPRRYGGAGGSLVRPGACCSPRPGRALCPTIVLQHPAPRPRGRGAWATPSSRRGCCPRCAAASCAAPWPLASPYDAADVRPTLRAERLAEGGLAVSGRLDHVLDADLADRVLVTATAHDVRRAGPAGRRARSTRGPPAGHARPRCRPARRPARSSSSSTTSSSAGRATGSTGPDGAGLRRRPSCAGSPARAVALQCMEMVGGAQRGARADRGLRPEPGAVRPADRVSFQAAQHLVADMHIAVEAPGWQPRSAVWWLGRGRPATRAVAIAKMHAARPTSGRPSTATSCTAAWATSSRPTCTCGPSGPRLPGSSAAGRTWPPAGCEEEIARG